MGKIPLSRKSRGSRLPRAILNRCLHCLARYLPMFPSMRVWLHRARGVKIGKNVFIGTEVFIDDAEPDLVVIEDDVTLIARTALLAHAYYPEHLQEYFAATAERRGVTIRKGAYLGFGTIVLPGVTIGRCAVIGAGTVVTRDVADYSVVLGVPGKVVRTLEAAGSSRLDSSDGRAETGPCESAS